jgi:ComF family protein
MQSCFRCGIPSASILCGPCRVDPPPFKRCFAPLRYDDPVDRLVTSFKDANRQHIGRVLACIVASRYIALTPTSMRPALVVPVPLTRERLRTRGFNQSSLIARYLVPAIPGARLDEHLCRRTRDTGSQKSLTADNRRRNIRNAFSCERSLNGEQIAIIDDVVTTASTVSELALTLIDNGAGDVEVIALARTPPG